MTDNPGHPTAAAMTADAFTLAELAREAEREVIMRENVYANRVSAGKMKAQIAARRIAMMRAIAERLRAEEEKERLL
jgi:hypothetical protein